MPPSSPHSPHQHHPQQSAGPHGQRHRATRACEPCRLSKRRCDSSRPCSNCVKKGLADSCPPIPPRESRRQSPSSRSGHPPVQWAASSKRGLKNQQHDHSRDRAVKRRVELRGSTATRTADSPPLEQHSPSSADTPQPRMLPGSDGEKVYVGSSAAISVLQFLRNVLRHYAGPSEFTESRLRHSLLEADADNMDSAEPFEDDLSHQSKLDLSRSYLEATSGLISIFTQDQIYELIELHDDYPVDPERQSRRGGGRTLAGSRQDRLVSSYLVVAIGACCRGQGEADARTASMYFSQAQKYAFMGMLHDPTFAVVNNFLLMAFYMLCASRRNTSLLYLGISARTATILGLPFSELFSSGDPEQIKFAEARSRTWKSLCVLDIHCNSILGRPTGVTALSSLQTERRQTARGCDSIEAFDTDADPAQSHAQATVNANYELCSHLEDISHALQKRGTLDLDVAQGFLQKLRDWANTLPGGLREGVSQDRRPNKHQADNGPETTPAPTSQHRQRTIGNIHVACGYYFGVLLITRPFLVGHVVATMQKVQRSGQERVRDRRVAVDRGDSLEVQELSQMCLSAAVHMMQMCQDAHSLDLLLNNMCVLQAWILAAGLVLGLALLVPGKVLHEDARSAFTTARRVTERMAKLNYQAQRNHQILVEFADAIELYRDKVIGQIQPWGGDKGNSHPEQVASLASVDPDPSVSMLQNDNNGNIRNGGTGETHLPGIGEQGSNQAALSSQHLDPEAAVGAAVGESSLLDRPLTVTQGEPYAENSWAQETEPVMFDTIGFQRFWDEHVVPFDVPSVDDMFYWDNPEL